MCSSDLWLQVNARRYEHALLVTPDAPVEAWPPADFQALRAEHFEAIAAHAPEIVLLGTGAAQRFPHPRLSASLAARRIAVEAMDTGAACRTYNILMAEGRKVLAALLPT